MIDQDWTLWPSDQAYYTPNLAKHRFPRHISVPTSTSILYENPEIHTSSKHPAGLQTFHSTLLHSNNAETLHHARNPQFSGLPAEIKLCIAEYIPPASASYLSLCNRTLEQILGPQSWSPLQHAGHQYRMEYVLTLARDLPADFACNGCVRWHRAWSVQWPLALPDN